jgi:putative spermidine/putrescine transport system substrate-binding protein
MPTMGARSMPSATERGGAGVTTGGTFSAMEGASREEGMMHRTVMVALAVSAAMFAGSAAMARDLTVVSPGGIAQTAQRSAFYTPFTKETGIPVKEDQWTGQISNVRAQVESGALKWDVVQLDGAPLSIGCDEGLFETVSAADLANANDLLFFASSKCGIGAGTWSSVLAYDAGKIPDGPKTWADFWNVQKWPGKRGLNFSPVHTFEIALLAEGVAPKDVYAVLSTPDGVKRALAKLDQLKPNILWWRNGAESTQRLASGEVAMTSAWNGRITALSKENKRDFRIVWQAGHVMSNLYLAMLKGTPNKDQARKFMGFWLKPEPEAAYMKILSYGLPNKLAYKMLDQAELTDLPSAGPNLEHALLNNVKFWSDNLERLQEQFNAWASK